jgi:hypothetical protein
MMTSDARHVAADIAMLPECREGHGGYAILGRRYRRSSRGRMLSGAESSPIMTFFSWLPRFE